VWEPAPHDLARVSWVPSVGSRIGIGTGMGLGVESAVRMAAVVVVVVVVAVSGRRELK
jgi:hypothetical protein